MIPYKLLAKYEERYLITSSRMYGPHNYKYTLKEVGSCHSEEVTEFNLSCRKDWEGL